MCLRRWPFPFVFALPAVLLTFSLSFFFFFLFSFFFFVGTFPEDDFSAKQLAQPRSFCLRHTAGDQRKYIEKLGRIATDQWRRDGLEAPEAASANRRHGDSMWGSVLAKYSGPLKLDDDRPMLPGYLLDELEEDGHAGSDKEDGAGRRRRRRSHQRKQRHQQTPDDEDQKNEQGEEEQEEEQEEQKMDDDDNINKNGSGEEETVRLPERRTLPRRQAVARFRGAPSPGSGDEGEEDEGEKKEKISVRPRRRAVLSDHSDEDDAPAAKPRPRVVDDSDEDLASFLRPDQPAASPRKRPLESASDDESPAAAAAATAASPQKRARYAIHSDTSDNELCTPSTHSLSRSTRGRRIALSDEEAD
jgi:hypothetical protein